MTSKTTIRAIQWKVEAPGASGYLTDLGEFHGSRWKLVWQEESRDRTVFFSKDLSPEQAFERSMEIMGAVSQLLSEVYNLHLVVEETIRVAMTEPPLRGGWGEL